ncbi:MAG: WD40 repeat domain-containing protein [Cognatishimia sp.]
MGFLNQVKTAVAAGAAQTLITVPAGVEVAVKTLYFNAVGGTANLTLNFFRQADGVTTAIIEDMPIADDTPYTFPNVIMLSEGDQITFSATANNIHGLLGAYQEGAGVPAAGAINPRGAYSAPATYNRMDAVEEAGSSYLCLTDGTTGDTPPSANWMLIAGKGDAGAPGADGEDGEDGVSGTSAEPGELVMSYATLAAPWLLADGGSALQSAHPDLYAQLGDFWPYETEDAEIVADTGPTGQAISVTFDGDSSHFAVGHDNSPYVSIYDWNAASPQKVANPATLPTGTGRDVAYSPNGNFLAVAHSTSPYVTFYDTSTPGGPVKMNNPASLPPANGYSVSWTSDSRYCVVAAYAGSNCLTIYDFDSGSPVKEASKPSTQPSGTGWFVRYSPDDAYLAVGNGSAPFITIYDNSDPANPTKLADPVDLPTTIVKKLEWSPDGRYIYAMENSSNEIIYDLNSGTPIKVDFDSAPVSNQGVAWLSNTEFVVLASTLQLYKIVAGQAVHQYDLGNAVNGLPHNIADMYFRSVGGSGHVVAVGASPPYLALQPRNIDVSTHFKLPNLAVDSDTFNPFDSLSEFPKIYVRGG